MPKNDLASTTRPNLRSRLDTSVRDEAVPMMRQHADSQWFLSQRTWQLISLLVVWIYLWSLQFDNDGLWYRGDAARHAMNGLFWIDYLRDFTFNAKEYALSYYARFPAIDPASRPPLFYLLEGAAFSLFGPSPYVAKGLVLCFALVAAVYLWAWLQRWVSTEAAWAAGLFLLLPGICQWSHAVMLNVPALAFSLAALYHTRSWLDTPHATLRNFWPVPVLTLCTVLTYYTAGVVICVIAGIILFHRGLRRPVSGKKAVLLIVVALGVLPFMWIILHWAPLPVSWIIPRPANLVTVSNWMFYPSRVLHFCNLHLLILVIGGAVSWLWSRHWRLELTYAWIWILCLYIPLSIIEAKEARYALLVSIPFIIMSAIAVVQVSEWLVARALHWRLRSTDVTVAVLLALLMLQVYFAASYRVTAVSGYKDVAAFLAEVAADEPVFFDGFDDGIFIFYVRAGDPAFRRRVVTSSKVLYTSAFFPGWQQQDFVHSPEDVIDVLRQKGGCRWFAIEQGSRTADLAPMRYLRQALQTPAFELVRSFPITAPQTDRVDIYRFTLPITAVDEVELPFAVLGPNVRYRVRPIPPRY